MQFIVLAALVTVATAWKTSALAAHHQQMRPAKIRRTLMQSADDEPADTYDPQKKIDPTTTGEGSNNYPWYLPGKEKTGDSLITGGKTAWKPGEEPSWSKALEAFNQGRTFNENLDKERGNDTGVDTPTIIGYLVLAALLVKAVQVALSLVVFD